MSGDQILDVHGAAAPDVAVPDEAGEGRHLPVGGVGRHHILVGEEEQGRTRPLPVKAQHEAAPVGGLTEDLAFEAGLVEPCPHELGHCRLVAGRVARVDPDEPAEQLAGLPLDLRDDSCIHSGDLHASLPHRRPLELTERP